MSQRQLPQVIRWFDDSPDAGDPACICSYCAERIEAPNENDWEFEVNADEGEPARMWTNGGKAPCKEATPQSRLRPFHAFVRTATLPLYSQVDLPSLEVDTDADED